MSTNTEDYSDLDDQLNAPQAEIYKFAQEGDEIRGVITNLEKRITQHGPVLIVTLRSNGKVYEVWCGHTALESQMNKVKPQVGDKLGIRYLGKVNGANGRAYHDYKVASSRKPPTFSWDGEPKPAKSYDDPWGSDPIDDGIKPPF